MKWILTSLVVAIIMTFMFQLLEQLAGVTVVFISCVVITGIIGFGLMIKQVLIKLKSNV